MALGFANWFQIVLYTLLLTYCGVGNGVREMSKQNLQQEKGEKNILLVRHSKDEEDMEAPLIPKIGYFTMKDVYVGKRMSIDFPNRDFSSSPHLLPREEADSIPFSSKELPNLLRLFSFSQGSAQAKAVEETIRFCELDTFKAKGETMLCATSLESMLDFVRGAFGLEAPFKVITTTHFPSTKQKQKQKQNYTILEEPEEISTSNMVACHPMPYPYAVFFCHSHTNTSKVFKIVVGGEDGNRVEAVAVCHMDTSHWNHNSFRQLGFRPGTSPVCHFFSASNLIWVSSRPTH
uniref:BURP domain-containing protein n=1 Tax=Davidia involucrata TaxID=16924 RepID=A0A5B6YIH0_DAVIN